MLLHLPPDSLPENALRPLTSIPLLKTAGSRETLSVGTTTAIDRTSSRASLRLGSLRATLPFGREIGDLVLEAAPLGLERFHIAR